MHKLLSSPLAKKTGFALFFLTITLLVTASVLNLRVLVDAQDVACLPFKVAIVRYHHIDEFKRGDIIAFTPPSMQMGSLFNERIIVKMVGAIPGDKVSVSKDGFSINDKFFGPVDIIKSAAKYMKRSEASFERAETVPENHLLMVGTLPRSFDGRYWGFLPQQAVLGTVYPIY